MNIVTFAKLSSDAIIPTKKFESDAGYDLYSSVDKFIYPNSSSIINTGITVEIPKDFYIRILPKSRSDFLIGGGLVDGNYQGELLVKIVNYTNDKLFIRKGDAVAQIVFCYYIPTVAMEVSKEDIHQEKTSRGITGGIVSQLSLLGE